MVGTLEKKAYWTSFNDNILPVFSTIDIKKSA